MSRSRMWRGHEGFGNRGMDIDMVTKKSVKRGVDLDLLTIHDSRNPKKYGVVMVHDDYTVKYTVQKRKIRSFKKYGPRFNQKIST